jgi:hypothetical protein
MPYNRMIPKSGYRFSDKIMRKRQSNTPPSTIASRLKKPAVGPVFGSIMLCARTTNKKEAERRQAHVFRWSAPQTSLRSLRKPSASGAARADRSALA